jgi:hypothetical protein
VRRSLCHRTLGATGPTCRHATSWDWVSSAATIRAALSGWRHGFEPRWDCSHLELLVMGRGAFLRNEFDPASEPKGHANFVELARSHRQHRRSFGPLVVAGQQLNKISSFVLCQLLP